MNGIIIQYNEYKEKFDFDLIKLNDNQNRMHKRTPRFWEKTEQLSTLKISKYMSTDLSEYAIQMFDNIVFFNNFFVVAYIFFIMRTIKKVNLYNIEMQTLIDLIY